MTNKQLQKEKIKAKQRAMKEAQDSTVDPSLRQTKNLDESLRDKDDGTDNKQAAKIVEAAMKKAANDSSVDPRVLKLFKDFKFYRVFIVVLVVIALGTLLLSMNMLDRGILNEETQSYFGVMSGIIMVVAMAIAFGRARPIREDITAWNKVNEMALRQSHGAHGATEADIDKIFLSRARNKRVPPTPEFKRVRTVWFVLIAIGAILMVTAVVLAQRDMTDVTVSVILIMVTMVFLIGATILDRVKMKPMREAWVKEIDARVKQANKASKGKKRK